MDAKVEEWCECLNILGMSLLKHKVSYDKGSVRQGIV